MEMMANKAWASSQYSLVPISQIRLKLCEFFFFFFLQMEIVHHMVCLKTLISAELFITVNVM